MKKSGAFISALAVCLTCLFVGVDVYAEEDASALEPVAVLSEAGEVTASGECGTNVKWTFSDEGVLTIGGTGDMSSYSNASNVPWKDSSSLIKSVVIKDGVTSVGNRAFMSCTELKTVSFGSDIKKIGDYAFYDTGLESLIIPKNVNSIGAYAFGKCQSLEQVTVSEGVSEIKSNAFINDTALSKVVLGEGIVTIGSSAFNSCTALTEITIPSTVTSASTAFSGCKNLSKIVFADGIKKIPNSICYNLSGVTTAVIPDSVTEIGSEAFRSTGLTGITLPEGLTTIGNNAFFDCKNIQSVKLNENITNIGSYAFDQTGIAEIVIPKSVTSLGTYVFANCKSLKKVEFEGTITSIPNYAFQNCNLLSDINFNEGLTSIGSYAFYYNSSLTEIVLPNGVTSVGSYAFSGDTAITKLVLPEGLTTLGSNAFGDCKGLTEITIPSTLTSASLSFNGCTNLTKVQFTEGTTKIAKGLFYNMKNLVSVQIPDTVTEIGQEAFRNTGLTSVELPSGVKTIGEAAFCDCAAMEKIQLPENLTSIGDYAFQNTGITEVKIPAGVTSISNYLFKNCGNLTKVTFNGNITKIGNYAFQNCKLLADIKLSSGLTSVGNYAFSGDAAITAIDLPEGLSSLGSRAFEYCTGLTSVVIPKSLTTASGAFYECKNLTKLTFAEGTTIIATGVCSDMKYLTKVDIPGTVTEIGDSAFSGSGLTEVVLHEGVTKIGNSAFKSCKELVKAEIPAGVKELGNYAFYLDSKLETVNLPDSITSIGEYAFYEDSLARIERLPKNLTTIGRNAFYRCNNLLEAEFGNSITSIPQYAFYECKAIKRIHIPDNVTSVGDSCFYGCENVTGITLGNGLTKIGGSSFARCSKITKITIPRNLSDAGTSQNGPFYDCTNLKTVTIADRSRSIAPFLFSNCKSIEKVEIPDSVTSIGQYAFYKCAGVDSYDISKNLMSVGNYAFYGNAGITKMEFSDKLSEIGNSAFEGCSRLSTVTLGKSLVTIPSKVFYGTAIEEVELPYCVSSIGANAFSNNSALKKITIYGFTSKIESSSFNQTGLIIYGSTGSVAETYASNKGYTFIPVSNVKGLEINVKDLILAIGEESVICAELKPKEVMDIVQWSTDAESIVSVQQDPYDPAVLKVKGVKSGEATITAKCGGYSKSCTIKVENCVTEIKLNTNVYSFTEFGKKYKLSTTIKPSNADNKTIIWSSSDSSVVTVDATGYMTSVGNGSARIIATDVSGRIKAYCNVTVSTPVAATSISIDPKEILLTGGSRQLSAVIAPLDTTEKQITWSSSDEGIATVDEKGVVRPVSEGVAIITATHNARGFSSDCKVTVKDVNVPVSGIAMSENNIDLNKATGSVKLSVSVIPANADIQDIVWTSSNTDVATVSDDGTVTAVENGSTTITAKTIDGGHIAVCYVNVVSLVDEIKLTQNDVILAVGSTIKLSSTVNPATAADTSVRWYSSNKTIADVNESGNVTAIKSGITYIRCKANDDSGVMASCRVTVVDAATYNEMMNGNSGSGSKDIEGEKVEGETLLGKAVITLAEPMLQSVLLHWNALHGADGYELQYSANPAFPDANSLYISGESSIQERIPALSLGTTYYFRVRGYKTVTNGASSHVYTGEWSDTLAGTAGNPEVDKCSIKSLKATGKTLTVTWNKAKSADGFEISYSLSKDFNKAKTVTVKNSGTLKKPLSKLKQGKKYYVRIRAFRNITVNGAKQKVYGEWSAVKSKKVKKGGK